MRSRNGSRPLLRAICALTLALSLGADEYIISYRAITENARLLSETLNVSPSMRPCGGEPLHALELDADENAPLETVLRRHRDAFDAYVRTLPMHVRSYSETRNGVISDRHILTLPPHCFTVRFNEGLVRISALN